MKFVLPTPALCKTPKFHLIPHQESILGNLDKITVFYAVLLVLFMNKFKIEVYLSLNTLTGEEFSETEPFMHLSNHGVNNF